VAPSSVQLAEGELIRGTDPCSHIDEFRRRPFVFAALLGLAVAGWLVQELPGAGFDRNPRIHAVRARADASVSEVAPRRNFGRARRLVVNATPAVSAYVRFDVDLRSDNIRHVSLLLYSRVRSRTGFRVQPVYERWKENRINFVNAPDAAPPFVASGPLRARSWKAVDVTSLALGEKDVSFALTTESPTTIVLASRETGLHGPRLVVEEARQETTSSTTTTGASPQPHPRRRGS
jgi:hypothetical protein